MRQRKDIEKMEEALLAPQASLAGQSRGRAFPEEEDAYRTIYQRDRDRILHSKAFRRLKHKTQVFIAPEGDHYRTRLTHTLEVDQIGRTMARALALNEDLVDAIALGHDVGHTPFGHAGEYVLEKILGNFSHADQSVRVLSFMEQGSKRHDYVGLNLSWEVLDGIKNHSGGHKAATLEGRLLKFADRIAYVNHDIDDSIRAGVLREEDLPGECTDVLGHSFSDRINRMVMAVIEASDGQDDILMTEEVWTASKKLRAFMYKNVYHNALVKSENDKLLKVIEDIFYFYLKEPERLPESHRALYVKDHAEDPLERVVADYVAGMTDDYLISTYRKLFIPQAWTTM